MEDLKKVLIVGVNSKIGSAVLDLYWKQKYICYGTYNKNAPPKDVKNKCNNILRCDLTQLFGINDLLAFSNKFKPYNIIYLPGYVDNKSLSKNDLQSMHNSFNVNVFAYWLLISGCIPYMKKKGFGRFLSLSSIGSKFGGGEDKFNYTTSKRMLEFFPKDFKNIARDNIFLNNIICGATNTPILKKKNNESIDQRATLIPVGRLADPKEIAKCCYQICSLDNTFQTLSNITIAGGE
ncbi:Hypothetical protein P9301_14391 [Prochlorococcus marinus str. MIT 9301]|uniref:NAD-dependent epimerase/dehydratase domain-containing protein n=1 Tax=Prochlorococcus marinus (strain MIT 9301) TaxID=167546 RepID=A3PE87_PROM0|nr:Hypothetical protein P9301_14391 [Prochlorococcus marinus str. MIT 9301]